MTDEPRKRSIPVGLIRAPELAYISRDGYFIKDTWPDKPPKPRADMLTRFLRIAESDDTEKVARGFVKKWGLLGLCEHGLPSTHNQECFPEDNAASYKRFGNCLEALRRIGLDLSAGRQDGRRQVGVSSGQDEDWRIAEEILFPENFAKLNTHSDRRGLYFTVDGTFRQQEHQGRRTAAIAREDFSLLIGRLTTLTRLHPRLRWDRTTKTWEIDFDSFGLSNIPALLVIQLMAQVGGKFMKRCRSCPKWFQPKGRQAYCGSAKCGIRASWRDSQRKRRSRLKPG